MENDMTKSSRQRPGRRPRREKWVEETERKNGQLCELETVRRITDVWGEDGQPPWMQFDIYWEVIWGQQSHRKHFHFVWLYQMEIRNYIYIHGIARDYILISLQELSRIKRVALLILLTVQMRKQVQGVTVSGGHLINKSQSQPLQTLLSFCLLCKWPACVLSSLTRIIFNQSEQWRKILWQFSLEIIIRKKNL